MEINRTFVISSKKSNRYWTLSQEISNILKIDKGRLFGLMKSRGIENVDEIFRKILKEDCKDRTSLFIYLVNGLPQKPRPKKSKQLKLIK